LVAVACRWAYARCEIPWTNLQSKARDRACLIRVEELEQRSRPAKNCARSPAGNSYFIFLSKSLSSGERLL
jgi:hypothetical protein